jgi:hypothetical protein
VICYVVDLYCLTFSMLKDWFCRSLFVLCAFSFGHCIVCPSIYGGARMAQWVKSLDLAANTNLSPIQHGFAPSFVNCKKGCTRLATASDKVYQLLVQCRWFSPDTTASSTTKTGRHDIPEILLKVALSTKIQIQIRFTDSNYHFGFFWKPFFCQNQTLDCNMDA